jgi:integrase
MEGSILDKGEKRNGHAWQLRVFVGRDSDGKRQYMSKTIYGSEKQAKTELRKFLSEKEGISTVNNDIFEKYYNKWLELYATTVRPSTYRIVKSYAKKYFIPLLGSKKLTKITVMDIQNVVLHMSKSGVGARSVRDSIAILGASFRQAIDWGMLTKSPTNGVKFPKSKKSVVTPFTQGEIKQLLEVSRFGHYGILYRFSVETGCRPGEITALHWGDIDFDHNRVEVTKTLSYVNGELSLNEPKTRAGMRSIPLSTKLIQELKKMHLKSPDKEGYVFLSESNKPIIVGTLARKFKLLLKEAKISTNHRLYDLRHTCATLLLLAGENPKIVSERLGHASIAITLDTYSHVLPTMQEKATSTLEKMLDL